MKNNNIEQNVKGNDNKQTTIVVQGDYVVGLQREEVIGLIKEYCQTDIDQIIQIVTERLNSIDEKNRKKPEKRVFVPLLQQLSYSLDEEPIKAFYRKLLESSMDKTKTVHPSFVQIISQLDSDEVKILNSMTPHESIIYPLIDVRMKTKNTKGNGITLISNFSDIGYGKCDVPGNICSYLENLERLKIIEIPALLTIVDKTKYDALKQHPAIVSSLTQYNGIPDITIEYDEKLFRLTRFGVSFLNACKG